MRNQASLKLVGWFLHLWRKPKKAIRLILIWVVVGMAGLASSVYLASTSMGEVRAAALPQPHFPQAAASAGFNTLPAQEVTRQITAGLDIMIVFDISGSTEDQTSCHDCWVRTSFDPNYPNNGYFNPLPYNAAWAVSGTENQSIPASPLCTEPVNPAIHNGFQYLVMEAELYSAEVGNWDLSARTPGQGFWVIQRGSYRSGTGLLGEQDYTRQGNQAGIQAQQSSNPCNPNAPGIDCTVGVIEDNICSAIDGGIGVDCSAYLSARPFINYSQLPGNNPSLTGGAYNLDCFLSGAGPHPSPPFTGQCWTNTTQNPFVSITGPGPSNVPWVEYDFTPTWNGNTTIWIRAIGSGNEAFTWAGASPDQLSPDLNGGGPSNNLSPWQKAIYWQVDNGQVYESNDPSLNTCCASAGEWRDNRAETPRWRWIKLGATPIVSGTQYTLKLYQGSAGYKVDKIIFTNDSSGTSNNPPAAMLLDYPIGAPLSEQASNVGPPASPGSATREACNVCNPAFGYTVEPSQCTCRRNGSETGYGTGTGCTTVLTPTNQLEDDLYSGIQPLRSAQEAVKHFARQLDPQCHQLGLVAYSTDTENGSDRRSKLQCLLWASNQLGEAGRCYDPDMGTPISHTNVISAVERHWATGSTDIAEGLREGLEELGIPGYAFDSNCTAPTNDRHACDRGGAAQKVIILLTDGTPNNNPGSCAPGNGRPDLWDGLIGTENPDFECAMYFAWEAANNNVVLYTVGIGSATNSDLLTAMATGYDPGLDTAYFTGRGGQYFAATNPADLESLFEHILGLTSDCGVVGGGLNGEQIWSASGYTVEQNQNLTVHLANHFSGSGPYDIYLGDIDNTYKICSAVNTGPTNAGDFECLVSPIIPPGFYNLYSTLAADQNPLAIAPLPVEVRPSSPQILINDGTNNIWATNSVISLTLLAHQVADEPFNLYLEAGANQLLIAGPLTATTPPVEWKIPATFGNSCPIGGPPCQVRTRRVSDLATIYAETDLYINQPQIVLAGGSTVYAPGETMFILLQSHTPGVAYDLKLSDGGANSIWLGRIEPVDAQGNSTTFVSWTVPADWPAGFYSLTSHPAEGSPPRDVNTMTGANQIALLENIEIASADAPFLTVDGGYTWPVDSDITIRTHIHQPTTFYYLKFGPWRVPTITSDDTFQTSGNGTAIITYHIPATATTAVSATFTISSFLAATDQLVATRHITVLPPPFITVLPGNQVLPGSTITIRLANHSPNMAYQLVYANKELLSLITDSQGQAEVSYDLSNLPATPPPDLSDPANYGIFFELYSRQTLPPQTRVATTTLAIASPSLALTKTGTPNPATAGQVLTYTLTVANSGSLTATGVLITDTLPGAVSFASASDGGLHQAGVVTWNIGSLPISQTITRTLVVTVSDVASGTILSNTAWVTSSEGISQSHGATTTVFASASSSVYLPTILKNQ